MKLMQSSCWGVVALLFLSFHSASAGQNVRTYSVKRAEVALFLEEHVDPGLARPTGCILLVHGLTQSSHEFDVEYTTYSLVNALVRSGYSTWLLDIAGYGRSGTVKDGFAVNTDYAAKDVVAAIDFIIRQTKVDRIDLLGWSWGTVIGAHVAVTHPSRIRRLVLYAPLIYGIEGDPPTLPFHLNNWTQAAEDLPKQPNGEIDEKRVERQVAALFLSNCWRYDGLESPNGGRRDVVRGSGTKLIDMQRIEVPVLVVGGSDDRYVCWQRLETDFRTLPRRSESELVKISGGGHILMLERDVHMDFQRKVIAFLTK